MHLPELSRRELGALLGAGGAAAALGGLTAAPASASSPIQGSLVMIIRHGEKPDASGNPPGIDEQGKPDPHSLTQRGWERAHALKNLFFPPKAGLVRPVRIYAPGGTGGEGRRPRETVEPLCEYLGIAVDGGHEEDHEKGLAEQLSLLGPGQPSLVSWEHHRIPAIISHLAGPVEPELTTWPDDRFDMVVVCIAGKKGWKLTQVPELLLPGDSSAPL